MIVLPSSVESYLKEAGFSVTEIIILQKLLIDDALTLRELAAKTGKSTGVLDQAVKKLIGKKILSREVINDQPKYTLMSLQPIQDWMQKDMKQKHEMLERRHSNFESFVATLQMDKHRPEMQYFEGWDGLKKAYALLLEPQLELLEYDPIPYKAEDDPLRDFKVEYFRERRRRRIYSRIIGPDTPLARRFQSRDPFEYRKTILIPEGDFGVHFHKVIVNDIVACIDYSAQRACFIRYPDFAKSERAVFEKLWSQLEKKVDLPLSEEQKPAVPVVTVVPLKTRFLSQLREFFLNRASIPSFLIFAILAGTITFGLYQHTKNLNFQRIRERAQSIATTGAFQFEVQDVEKLQVEADWQRPEWSKVVNQLKLIRESNEDVVFAYIIRRSKDNPNFGEFVADSYSLNPYANIDDDPNNDVDVKVDANGDGIMNAADSGANLLQWPGQPYDTIPPEAFDGYSKPTSTSDFYEDQWGKMVTGYAPIRDLDGKTAGVLAIDVLAGTLSELNKHSFNFILCFLGVFLLFIATRFAAQNKSLFREAIKLVQVRNVVALLTICSLLALGITYGMHTYTAKLLRNQLAEQLKSIASTAASEFEAKDLDELHFARDMKKEAYQKVFKKLNEIRDNNENIVYVYIMRRTEDPEVYEFIADADSNYNLPFLVDLNNDGILDETDEAVAPGVRYVTLSRTFPLGFEMPAADMDMVVDQWGTFISGYAPIKDAEGRNIAALEVDMDISKIKEAMTAKFSFPLAFFGLFSLLLMSIATVSTIKKRFLI